MPIHRMIVATVLVAGFLPAALHAVQPAPPRNLRILTTSGCNNDNVCQAGESYLSSPACGDCDYVVPDLESNLSSYPSCHWNEAASPGQIVNGTREKREFERCINDLAEKAAAGGVM
ncbi:MAG: hypothetical protein HY548_05870, partial [Elusimicrobia bacterium]|nr:hypothetical protein [Elusimicrobiota bacterium]